MVGKHGKLGAVRPVFVRMGFSKCFWPEKCCTKWRASFEWPIFRKSDDDDLSIDLSNVLSNDLSNVLSNNLSNVLSNDLSKDLSNVLSNVSSNDLSNVLSNDLSNVFSNDFSNVLSNDLSNVLLNNLSNVLTKDSRNASRPADFLWCKCKMALSNKKLKVYIEPVCVDLCTIL